MSGQINDDLMGFLVAHATSSLLLTAALRNKGILSDADLASLSTHAEIALAKFSAPGVLSPAVIHYARIHIATLGEPPQSEKPGPQRDQ